MTETHREEEEMVLCVFRREKLKTLRHMLKCGLDSRGRVYRGQGFRRCDEVGFRSADV